MVLRHHPEISWFCCRIQQILLSYRLVGHIVEVSKINARTSFTLLFLQGAIHEELCQHGNRHVGDARVEFFSAGISTYGAVRRLYQLGLTVLRSSPCMA